MASGSHSEVVINLDIEDGNEKKPNNMSMQELISSLKSTFQAKYLTEVESILTSREEKSQLEITNLKKQNELLIRQYEVERLQKLGIESEAKKHKAEICVLKEENSRLSEDRKVFSEREKGAEERIKNLVEEVKRIGEEDKEAILELRSKNCELENEKRRAETEVEIWKRRFRELETRIVLVEEDVKLLLKVETPPRPGSEKSSERFVEVKNEENGGPSCGPCGSPMKGSGDLQSKGSGSPSQNIIEIMDSDDDFAPGSLLSKKDMTSQRPADSAHPGQTGVNGTKMFKRKLDSCLNTSGNENGDNDDANGDVGDNSQSGKHKIKKLQESAGSPVNCGTSKAVSFGSNDNGKFVTPSRLDPVILRLHDSKSLMPKCFWNGYDNSDSEDSSSSSDSEGVADMNFDFSQSLFKSQRNKDNKRWDFEAEMLAAFEKNAELCMKAVCALYRQQTSVGNSPRGLISNNRGFNKFDACRGTSLAKFLINGDPEGKLKKSVKELLEYDKKGLDDCKRLAIEHSKQLFEIYQNQKKEDPLFYP